MTVGQPERAARLLGAADALRRASRLLRLFYQEQYRRALAAARAGLAEPAFAAALAEAAAVIVPAETAASVDAGAVPGGLTLREVEVLRLLVDGRTDREIGNALSISHRTVMRHVAHILEKLEVDPRTAAAARAVRGGLV